MRTVALALVSASLLGLCAYLSARPQGETVKVRLLLLDADSGKGVAGILRALPADGDKPLPLPGLYPRLRGLGKAAAELGWHVIPAAGAETTLPRGKLRLEAVSGLETALSRLEIDPSKFAAAQATIKLRYLFRPERQGLVAGNTHLHLRDLSADQSDEYLRTIPPADGLKVLFISYLERHNDDKTYITNRYPVGDLKRFDSTGVLISNGEEHRHNFKAFGEGYGHVMFLGIKQLVQPVSIGPGITGAGNDEPALRPGIDNARKQGGTVIWCHNTSGLEDIPSALTRRLHALNVFDGSRSGRFEDGYYHYLNVGLHLPLSTGTDWFLYDYSRVYAGVQGKVGVESWLEGLKAGRAVATNGPLLTLTVDDRNIGEIIELAKPKAVSIKAAALGRHDFERLELVHNGKVIKSQPSQGKDGSYRASIQHTVRVEEPGWFAVRIDSKKKNEFDKVLYAHSSPVYVRLQGRDRFDVEAARALLKQLEEGQAAIRARGRFSNAEASQRVLALYEAATRELTERAGRQRPK
ncbi:MAG: CehA/McbA family metallohydrolase [Gemmataceae bacterium]|nr:CehA/McbA family metallohydrolase [Gemmataceae bacterium]